MRFSLVFLFTLSSCASRVPLEVYQLSMQEPTPGSSESVGSYGAGCLKGAEALDISTKDYELMRPSRGRFWAHSQTIHHLESIAKAYRIKSAKKMIVGDLGHAKGGPSFTGHTSHQNGLDADIWLQNINESETFKLRERHLISANSVLDRSHLKIEPDFFNKDTLDLIKIASEHPQVQRIFVHPTIKKHLCTIREQVSWNDEHFKKLRPWWGHHHHMHLRFRCHEKDTACVSQKEPDAIECGEDLEWWYKPGQGLNEPSTDAKPNYLKSYQKRRKKLPEQCRNI